MQRFNGADAWASLSPAQKDEIGALALETVAALIAAADSDIASVQRAGNAAGGLLIRDIEAEVLSALVATGQPLAGGAIPSRLGPVCRACGCSEHDACDGGCAWFEEDLCSACEQAMERAVMEA